VWTEIAAPANLHDCVDFPMVNLLHLPIELRVMIWSLLLPSDTTVVSAQRKQLGDLRRSTSLTVLKPNEHTQSATVTSDLLIISPLTFSEVAHTFYGANTFCFDIRDADAIDGLAEAARSYINHVRLVDRLRYVLPTICVERLVSGFRNLRSISIPTYPEPFGTSSFDINLEHRAINLSIVRGLMEQLENGHYKQLFLNYNQPCSILEEDLDHLLTLRLLRHLRSANYYIDNNQMDLWLEMFVAWIYSYPLKRPKLLKVLERMDSAYDRSFFACLVKRQAQDQSPQGFTIALSIPKHVPHARHRATCSSLMRHGSSVSNHQT
jgi:hypothetical protein